MGRKGYPLFFGVAVSLLEMGGFEFCQRWVGLVPLLACLQCFLIFLVNMLMEKTSYGDQFYF